MGDPFFEPLTPVQPKYKFSTTREQLLSVCLGVRPPPPSKLAFWALVTLNLQQAKKICKFPGLLERELQANLDS